MRKKIPANISSDHILLAINELDKTGVPKEHQSTKFDLSYNGKNYPPKYVIRTANIFANGEPFETELFSGGDEANSYLSKLGFEIQQKTFSWTIVNSSIAVKKMDKSSFIHHGTGIPIEIRKYFELNDIMKGYQCPVNLVYQDNIFEAVISADNQPNPRTRLMWHENFAKVIRNFMPLWYDHFSSNGDPSSESPEMRFIKTGQPNEYKIELTNPKDIFENAIAEEIPEKEIMKLPEGAKKQTTINAYERNPKARELCIQHYGFTCSICEFNFEEIYGEIGKEYIHVHHLKPLSEIDEEYQVDPINDLRPVCPNCHSMLHKANYSIEQLRDTLRKRQEHQ